MVLYSTPSAKVFSADNLPVPFQITNGTRQGCPLSPLLFNLFMEPLAESIRSKLQIKGISHADQEHKISLFADDVILMLTDPDHSLPEIQKMLAWFSNVSYYKVNKTKSYILI